MANDSPHNTKANDSFKEADKHAEAGNAKEMWRHLGDAQKHAANHAHDLSEGGQHSASVAYRKMTLGQVSHTSRKVINKAISEFRMVKYSALSALWQVMKENGPRPYALAVPQVELAHSASEIENILHKYGIKLQKSEELEKAKHPPLVSDPIHMAAHHDSSPYKDTHTMVHNTLMGTGHDRSAFVTSRRSGIESSDMHSRPAKEWKLKQQKRGYKVHETAHPSRSAVYISAWKPK